MSNLVYQNYNNRYKGWVNPSNLSYGPEIISLSTFQSPAGSSTVVSIYGTNFFSYSTIRFGTFTPTVYFVNSTILQFYVPNSLNSGTFTVQVCNGSVCSNTVNYTIDNASGYWLLNSNGNITNTNNTSGGVGVSWLSKGAPIIIDNSSNDYNINEPYKIPDNNNWIICSNDNFGANQYFIELPTGAKYNGREIMIKNNCISDVVTQTNVVIPLNRTEPSGNDTVIVRGYAGYSEPTGFWSTLVYDATSNIWYIMQANWNSTS